MKKVGIFLIFAVMVMIPAAVMMPLAVNAHGDSHIVRIGLLRAFNNRDAITVSNGSIFVGYWVEEGFMPITELHSPSGFTMRAGGGSVEILSGGTLLYTFAAGYAAQIMASDGEVIRMGGYSYRGVMEFIPSGGRISAVNVLSLEEYLFGVLPSEMSPSFQMEALMAQAVASRTYAFSRIRRGDSHRGQPFDLCDRTCCQVYRGAATEHERTTQAVFQTYGLMLFYGGRPILAQYFSSSGGATENSEDVFWENRPYARSVNSKVEHNPLVWERTYTWAQLTQAAAHANAGIGAVSGISISRLGASGRVLELTLHGANGTWSTSVVRGFFTPIGGSIPSRNFTIAGAGHTTPAVSASAGGAAVSLPLNSMQAVDSRGVTSAVHHGYIFDGTTTRRVDSTPTVARGGAGITLSGRGWGHGVGMSQLGAEGMARAGYNFIEILTHYYTGVEIRWYE